MNIGDKVNTPCGVGIIKDIEDIVGTGEYIRYGVELENPTPGIPISYFFKNKVTNL